MILSHMASACLNMSPYPAIWIHFNANSMVFMKFMRDKFYQVRASLLAGRVVGGCSKRRKLISTCTRGGSGEQVEFRIHPMQASFPPTFPPRHLQRRSHLPRACPHLPHPCHTGTHLPTSLPSPLRAKCPFPSFSHRWAN